MSINSIEDFVLYVLNIPPSICGFAYMVSALRYVIQNDGDPHFYKFLQQKYNKPFGHIEKTLRYAKNTAVKSEKIFPAKDLKTKEFVCWAAQYYRREFKNENKES